MHGQSFSSPLAGRPSTADTSDLNLPLPESDQAVVASSTSSSTSSTSPPSLSSPSSSRGIGTRGKFKDPEWKQLRGQVRGQAHEDQEYRDQDQEQDPQQEQDRHHHHHRHRQRQRHRHRHRYHHHRGGEREQGGGGPGRQQNEAGGAVSATAPVPTSLRAQVTTLFPSFASASSTFGGSAAAGDMEMKPIAGHRRRKSSTIGPLGLSGVGPGRPMSQGASRRQHHPDNSPHPPDHALAAHAAKSHSPSPGSGSASGKEESGADSFSDDDLRDDEETGLTNKERARRQKRKQRNTQLGQRVAREKSLSAAERKEANKDVIKRALMNGLLILLWYFFSLSISLYNKWMFDSERLNFAFPLFTTSMHMLVQFGLAALVLYLFPSLRPAHGHTSDMGRSRHETETNSSGMTKLFYITRVGPCGAATGLDIGLGNTSLKFISLTFYTMCKSSSLAFVLLFAFVFRLEKPTWRLVGIIATMTMGVILMVSGEIEFKFGGFVLVISAAAFSGFRWSLTQILLLRNPTTSNPFSSIFFLTPVMFVTIILIAVPVEGFGSFCAGFRALSDEWGAVMAPLFLLFPGCIAFLMTASEFALLKRTSVVTLSIAGIFKEVVTISAASLVFKDKLTLVNFVGLVTTMVAIVAYNYIKIKKMREEARGRAVDADHPPLSSSASDVDDSNEEAAGLLSDNIEMSETPMAPTRSQARTSTSYVKHEDEH